MNPYDTFQSIESLRQTLAAIGGPYELALAVIAAFFAIFGWVQPLRRWNGWLLASLAALLLAGEAVLVWFHLRLYQFALVVSPDGASQGSVAVPLWVESEKLFVWALLVALVGALLRRQRRELVPGVLFIASILALGAALLGKPFTQPVPSFFGQYYGYLQAMQAGGAQAFGAYTGMESARQFYYNAWYMWVHPPMLFLSYAAFAVSFVATLHMIAARHVSFEVTAYRWARFGYLWLTLGMLLGFPWALSAWQGEAWWWSGKVNMSLMMWLLYTGVLHARLYLRAKGMWKAVAALAVVSFVILVLTYVTTYIVPGAHSYASAGSIATLLSGSIG